MLFISILENIGSDLVIGIISALVTLVGGYIVIRERLLKNEIKTENIYTYIDGKQEIIENKIQNLQADIVDFKELNKETSRSLAENTTAIRELKFVLNILKEKLDVDFKSRP